MACSRSRSALLVVAFMITVTLPTQGIDSCVPGPAIIARSDGCSAVSRGSVSYTCRSNGNSISWKSDIFTDSESITVIRNSSATNLPNLDVTGVTIAENSTGTDCGLKSTLKLSGSLEKLQQLHGLLLECEEDNATIVVPNVPEPPIVDQLLPINCGGPIGTHATLEWAPPTNTGGEGVSIERYIVNVITASGTGYTSLPDQCNVTTPNTTITGLQCNTSYTVTVTAVNCVGQSIPSTPVTLNITNIPNATLTPPPILKACLTDNNITLRWMRPSVWSYDSTCAEVLQYSLTISNSRGEAVSNTATNTTSVSLPVPRDNSYTISLTATTVCGSSNNTIAIDRDINSCITPIVPCKVTTCPGMGGSIAATFIVTAIVFSLMVFLITFLPTFFCCRHRHCNPTQDECSRPSTLPLNGNRANDTTCNSVSQKSPAASNPSFETPCACELNPCNSAEHIQTNKNIAYPPRIQIHEMRDGSSPEFYSMKD